MRMLNIDIETYSSVDITRSGVYAYVNAPDFEILLIAYALSKDGEDGPVKLLIWLPERKCRIICETP